jgi:two-component system response regulator DevR
VQDGVQGGGAPPAVRVLLVDDHEVVILGLKALLASVPDVEVVGQAATAAGAVAEAARLQPDVVILDVRLPDGSGVEACREIRAARPETRVLMLTSYADDEALFSAIMAGASGYLLKQSRGRELIDAIRTVRAGGSLLDPAVTGQVLQRLRAPATAREDPLSELSETERRILSLMAEGKTNREIARVVYLSDKTVKHYVSNILRKLDVARRSEATALWARAQAEQRRAE